MTNVAVFTDSYDEVNGVALIYRNLVRAAAGMPECGDRLTVFCRGPETVVERQGCADVFHYRARPSIGVPRYKLMKVGWISRGQVGRDFAEGDFDAVVVAAPAPLGFIGKQLARRHGLPLIGFYHTRFPAYLAVYTREVVSSLRVPEMAERLGFRVMRRLYGACDLILAQSSAMAEEVCRVSDAPLAIWETGVDLSEFNPGPRDAFRKAHGISTGARVVVYVGRVAREKDLDLLAALSQRMVDVHFLVVGDGPYAPTLKAISRATFTGFLSGEELVDAFRAGDVFLFPSTTDAFGNVLVEAMAVGLPLVVVDTGPPADLIARSGAGLTFTPGDLDAAEHALRQITHDPVTRSVFSARALAHVARLDWPVAYQRFMALCAGAPNAAI